MKLRLLAAAYVVALHSVAAYAAPVQTYSDAGPKGNAPLSNHPTASPTRSAAAVMAESARSNSAASRNEPFKVSISRNSGADGGGGSWRNTTGTPDVLQNTADSGADTLVMLLTAFCVMGSIVRRRRLAKKMD